MAPKIERVTESSALGEGPHWDADAQCLYYVDIITSTIHRYVPATKKATSARVGHKQVSFIVPVEGLPNQFVISANNEVVRVVWGDDNSVTEIETLAQVDREPEFEGNRFNDGKCDASGRLWAGTMNNKAEAPLVFPAKGTLYSLDANRAVSAHLTGLRISNGMAFNEDEEKMYFIDSSKLCVEEYDFDLKKGTIENGRVIFSLDKNNISGIADGMTIDADGNLWVANFNGGRVLQINPKKPETLLRTIEMPVKQITSLAFGGVNLSELYVTTGAFKMSEDDYLPTPANGSVYRISNIGTRGLAGHKFRLQTN